MEEHLILSYFLKNGSLHKEKFKNFAEYESYKKANKYYASEVASMIHEGNGLYREWDGVWEQYDIDMEGIVNAPNI